MPEPVAPRLFHITTRGAADAARQTGSYRAASLATEGYIHLSQAHQVAGVARAFYAGQPDLVLLVIDATRLAAPLRYEAPGTMPAPSAGSAAPAADERFPHLYGALEAAAIVDVVALADFLAGKV